eukprot:14808197-Ditylum_brightwellii.AAC.1
MKKLEEDHPSCKELVEHKVEGMSSVKEKTVCHIHALMNHDVKAIGVTEKDTYTMTSILCWNGARHMTS